MSQKHRKDHRLTNEHNGIKMHDTFYRRAGKFPKLVCKIVFGVNTIHLRMKEPYTNIAFQLVNHFSQQYTLTVVKPLHICTRFEQISKYVFDENYFLPVKEISIK